MNDRMVGVPELISLWLAIADRAELQFEHWMQQADDEPRPYLRVLQEEIAADSMNVSNAARADAERVLREYKAAGGVYDRSKNSSTGVLGGGLPNRMIAIKKRDDWRSALLDQMTFKLLWQPVA
jgi:hypothetical protein